MEARRNEHGEGVVWHQREWHRVGKRWSLGGFRSGHELEPIAMDARKLALGIPWRVRKSRFSLEAESGCSCQERGHEDDKSRIIQLSCA